MIPLRLKLNAHLLASYTKNTKPNVLDTTSQVSENIEKLLSQIQTSYKE